MKLRSCVKVLTLVLLGGLYSGGPGAPAMADTPAPPPVAARFAAAGATLPVSGGTRRFVDVPRSHQFYTPITWMYAEGLSTGIRSAEGIRYAPKDGVSREAVAAFLYRMQGATYRGPVRSPFVDVRPGDKFYDEIAWMYAEGLSTGIQQDSGLPAYAPKARVSREAMAAFIYRLEDAAYRAPAVSPFADLGPGDKFYREIAWMYAEGLSTGIKQNSGKPRYAPKSRVSREAMAAFLYRLAGEPAVIDSGTLTIAGTPTVGKTVTAQTGGWQPAGVSFAYQWFLDGREVAGATSRTLTLDAGAEGRQVQVTRGAVNSWLASPDHLRNITASSWDTTGVGVDVRQFTSGHDPVLTGLTCTTVSQIFENRP